MEGFLADCEVLGARSDPTALQWAHEEGDMPSNL